MFLERETTLLQTYALPPSGHTTISTPFLHHAVRNLPAQVCARKLPSDSSIAVFKLRNTGDLKHPESE